MLSLGGLAFAAPWILAALAALPIVWWLLRIHPPAPRRLAFPAVRLLLGLREVEETPAHTPPWLLLLRLLIAALIVVAAARPLLDAPPGGQRAGPLALVVDNGWAAAPGWERRIALGEASIEAARLENRAVLVAATAPAPSAGGARAGFDIGSPGRAADALAALYALEPRPWPVDRAAFADAFAALPAMDAAEIIWLSDGVADGDPADTERFVATLSAAEPLTVYLDPPEERAMAMLPPTADGAGLTLRLVRPAPGAARRVTVRAVAADGRALARQTVEFEAGAATAERALDIPPDLRNEIVRLTVEGQASAAATVFLDERYRRRPVGLVSGGGFESSQPLLSDLYYLERALAPSGDVRRIRLDAPIDEDLSVVALADLGRLTGDAAASLAGWVQSGGVLVRFAGPRVAEGVDGLVPVRLRAGGGRALGGALAWEAARGLGPFPDDSPFAGLAVPADVRVERQVLAEPSPDLDGKTWAQLDDGTPLVTAERRGAGWLALFHTTANAEWSSLALSGLFVDMMRRIALLGEGVAGGDPTASLAPVSSLDGFGRLGGPDPLAAPIPGRDFAAARPGPARPPGEYGDPERRRALNLGDDDLAVSALGPLPGDPVVKTYAQARLRDLRPWLLAAALALALADTLIGLRLRGRLPAFFRRGAAALAALAVVAVPTEPAAQEAAGEPSLAAADIARHTRFAYVVTGDPAVDRVSAQGLAGLSWALRARTAIEAGPPAAIDPAVDELAFFPLIYWPATDGGPPPGDIALARVDAWLRRGGLILFDTRDGSPSMRAAETPRGDRLRRMLRGLNIPPLRPVPPDHALTRAFYLIDRFPGRWDGGDVWVERYEGGVNDGVSSIVVGGNDYAAAWARDADGFPLYPVVPGVDRQREWALRFGINLAMYALTGNYKADQVHIPAILRRLGRAAPEATE